MKVASGLKLAFSVLAASAKHALSALVVVMGLAWATPERAIAAAIIAARATNNTMRLISATFPKKGGTHRTRRLANRPSLKICNVWRNFRLV